MEKPEKETATGPAMAELEAATPLVAPPVERGGFFGHLPQMGWLTAKSTSFRMLSATTASFFLISLFVATVVYTKGIDVDFEKYDQRNLSKSELDKYLAEDRLSSEETCDVLDHWCKNSAHYPILSSMARDILAIPITSVASESTFSMGGRIISKSRNALKDTNIEVLVTCKNWFTSYDDFNLEGVTVGDVHLSTNKENQ